MRPSTFKTQLFIALAIFSGIVMSCQKSERDLDEETLAARDNALAYHIFDDAFREVHRIAMRDSLLNDTGILQRYDRCVKRVTFSDTVAVFPLYVNINYGDDTARCNDGFRRYGALDVAFSGKYLNKDTKITISFADYRKDLFDVEGSMIVTNLGLNSDGRRVYRAQVIDGLITGNNIHIDWNGDHNLTWISGSSTDGKVDDDIFEMSGLASGRNSRGNTFENSILIPYKVDFSCQWMTSGTSELDVPNLQTRYISYGSDSDCDNILSQSRDNSTFEVRIPY